VQAALRRPESDFDMSKWDDARRAVSEIDSHIAAIEREDYSRLPDLTLLFAPTGSIQEVSVSSGWGDQFLTMADRFDKAAAEIR
jgi:hypothetical protein